MDSSSEGSIFLFIFQKNFLAQIFIPSIIELKYIFRKTLISMTKQEVIQFMRITSFFLSIQHEIQLENHENQYGYANGAEYNG